MFYNIGCEIIISLHESSKIGQFNASLCLSLKSVNSKMENATKNQLKMQNRDELIKLMLYAVQCSFLFIILKALSYGVMEFTFL